jgi:transposase-like protein
MCWSLAVRVRVPPTSRPINYTGRQKIAILREHLVENVPVSEDCKTHGISVVNFYNWQKILFEKGAALFERKPNASSSRRQEAAAVLFRQAIS